MEVLISVTERYRIELLSQATLPGALSVIKEHFCQDELMCQLCEVHKSPDATEDMLAMCADAALDGISLVAVTQDTNEVVAAAFNKIHIRPKNPSDKSYYEEFAGRQCTNDSSRALIEYMVLIEENCNLFEIYNSDCSVEIMFLGIHRDHRKQGLGMILSNYSIELAKKIKDTPPVQMSVENLGSKYVDLKPPAPLTTYPKFIEAILTAEASKKIAKTFDFTVHFTVYLKDLNYKGMSLADVMGNESIYCNLVAKRLY